jgi:hypothetical protein
LAAPAPAAAGSDAGSAAPAPAPAATWTVTIDGTDVKLAPGESIDTDVIERIVGQLTSIDLKTPADPKRDASSPTATISVHKKGAEQSVVMDVIADGESYWVHQREIDRAILVDKIQLSDAVGVDRDKLVKKPPPAAGSGADPGAMQFSPPGVLPQPFPSGPAPGLPPGVAPPPPPAPKR